MKESFYFQHDYDALNDPKIQALISEFKAEGYGIYWAVIELLHKEQSHQLPLKNYIYSAIAKQMSTSVEQVENLLKYAIDECELFTEEDGFFYSNRVLRNFEKREEIIEKRRLAGQKSAFLRSKGTSVQQNSTSVEQNSTKEKKKNRKEINIESLSSVKKDSHPFPEIPDSLKAIPEFPETWESFLTNRKQMKHPVTGEAAKQLFRKLATLIDPVSELTRSIEKNWQGLFPNFDNIKPAYELSRDLHRLLIHIHQTTTALRTLKPLTPERADAFMKLYPEKIIPEKIAEIEQALMKKEITGKTMEEAIKNWRAK